MKKVIIMLMMLSVVGFSKDTTKKYGLQKNNLFPEITLISTDGKDKITSKELEGKKTIYSFVTTWCTYCTEERPLLSNFYKNNKKDLNVVSIFIGGSGKSIDEYVKKHPAEYKYYHDKDEKIANKFIVRGTPTTYVVDEEGVIMARISGAVNWDQVTIEELNKLQIQ